MTDMKLRYELKDREHPSWRGERFTTLERATKALRQSVPSGRFYLYDRQNRVVRWESDSGGGTSMGGSSEVWRP